MTGVVFAGGGDEWWAWSVAKVVPSALSGSSTPVDAPAVHNEHSGSAATVMQVGQLHGGIHFHEGEALAPDDSVWLRSAWETLGDSAMEIRYLTTGSSTLDAYLVVRTQASSRDAAEARVTSLRSRLAVPPHCGAAVPVADKTETHAVLDPFPAASIVEIRKRITVQRATRHDAVSPWLSAVIPFAYRRQPWDALWSALAAVPFRAMLSIGLAPYRIGPGLRSHLAARAAEFTRLAQRGPSPTGVWSNPRPPDEFAVAAAPLVADAVRRYVDRAFLTRVTLAADHPVPALLAELAAVTISPPTPNSGFVGAGPVVTPLSPPEHPTAWNNVTALNFTPLPAHLQGHPPETIGDLERTLSTITDLDESAAAFRLPYRTPGTPSPFDG
ncbi:hypothetical protein [Actinokineospora inagensis]|uniref:hypothetical protein n=1 Tax=Actinokineospora inagensis TaxID=103730 RepID=UPI0003FAE4B2|nr:hypothetical protein [Actinokineospora inagensis]